MVSPNPHVISLCGNLCGHLCGLYLCGHSHFLPPSASTSLGLFQHKNRPKMASVPRYLAYSSLSVRPLPPSQAKTRNPIPKTRRTACGRQPHFRGMAVDAQWYPRKSAAAVSPPDSPCYQPGLFPFTFDDEGPLGLTLDEGYRDHGPRIMSLVPDSQAERLNVPIGHAYIASVNGTDLNAKSQSFKQRHEMIANAKRPLVLHVWVPPRKDETKSVSPPLTPTSPRSPFSLLRSSRSSSASDVRQSL